MKSINKKFTVFLLLGLLTPLFVRADDDSDSSDNQNPFKSLKNLISAPSDQPSSVAGVRGLEEGQGPVDTKARDYAAAGRIETYKVSQAELAAFVEEGKLK